MSVVTSFPDITYRLQNIWKHLTDDEAICYESNDQKFYETVKQKYGLSRDDIKQIRWLILHDRHSYLVCQE